VLQLILSRAFDELLLPAPECHDLSYDPAADGILRITVSHEILLCLHQKTGFAAAAVSHAGIGVTLFESHEEALLRTFASQPKR
jgi:hypothetical protein